ncbi:transglutaminase domain-containing protein [Alkaliphilus serpentinus]|uniref:Transglutaminase domain-containing protein n=1 Tax=Alkaliphilus serpentinus TaxID=1482731 RepID=A0A833HQ61_9FIRM|nr:transglutaminase domain-containing protein [Alkaliphilus serpentinus]KAB3531513.1 transglutaminase domain-containing protein [Alkaliphilus serpentinus]
MLKKIFLSRKSYILHMMIFLTMWTLFTLYPNPYRLVVTVHRFFEPAISPSAVKDILPEVKDLSPAEIEAYVIKKIPYQFDWQTYGLPLYFPTAEEAIVHGRGDCKGRFVVLASIFEALEIPYTQSFSLSHFWVHYEGKVETKLEASSNALLLRTEEGTKLQIPKEDLKEIYETLKEGFWDYMPLHRRTLFVAGLPLTILMGILSRKKLKKLSKN